MLLRPQGLLGNVEWGFLKRPLIKLRGDATPAASASK
jgi:hypothetical protein